MSDHKSLSAQQAAPSWKVGDWAIHDRDIVQIKDIREHGMEVSNGSFTTYGDLSDRLRPLTLGNKQIAEFFEHYYKELRSIRGERGFNYPDINRYFTRLSLRAMDGENNAPFDLAREFVQKARDYIPMIDGINLFRA